MFLKSFSALSIGLLAAVSITTANADQNNCAKISSQAAKEEVLYSPPVISEVIGEGRLYFYTAPDEKCQNKVIFVVTSDHLTAYSDYKGWVNVMYINPKNGKDYDGWVLSSRIKLGKAIPN